MKNIARGAIFFVGWLLSPLTWWNDAFINIPLSYLLASALYGYWSGLSFGWLMLGSYWFTNAVGLAMMSAEAAQMIKTSRNWKRTVLWVCVSILLYSGVMFYLDRTGRLPPLGKLLEHGAGSSGQRAMTK